jgi:predicted O-methyltransferase YrrM
VLLKKIVRKIIFLLPSRIRPIANSSLFDILVLRNKYSLSHLRTFEEYPAGPIQRDEALLLYALVKTVDPKTIVEFGFLAGHSALLPVK